MSINNTIAQLAQLLGLKDSRESTVLQKKEAVFRDLQLNEELLEGIKTEMADIESQLRMRKEEYLHASPGIQLVVKTQILAVKQRRDAIVHRLAAIADRVNAKQLLLGKYETLLYAIRNPAAIDEMEDVRDELDAWSRDLAHERKTAEKLTAAGRVTETAEAVGEALENDGDFGKAVNREDPEFAAFLDTIH